MGYPTELIEKAKYEMKVFERVSSATGEQLISEVERLRSENGALQAKIDALMLEFCQNEMTPEQLIEWRQSQRPLDPIEQHAINQLIDEALK